VLLPSHKSHVDYLVLSDVLFANALSPPLIAAGDNLSFWPLGPVLRRAGAFFIKRSFRGKRLYAALVDAYIRKLLVEGFNIEFFLEGGRSRTGKLLPPKLGLLSMVVDACLVLPSKRVFFVPISIGYERVVEERSYVDELSGGEKQKENIGGLLKTPKVLRSRYGRLYVQFGEIIEFADVVREVAGEDHAGLDRELKPPERRNLVQTIGHRVVYEINEVTVVTPAALVASVVLAHRRRGITRPELLAGAQMLADALRRLGARFARSIFAGGEDVRPDTIAEAIELFVDGKLMTVAEAEDAEEPIYSVPEERRIALEYYKNNILHFFVASALISAGLLAKGGEAVSRHTLRERVLALSRLFKYEFMYRADADFEEIFDDALGKMIAAGEVMQIADTVRAADGDTARNVTTYAMMVRTYFETYRLAIRGLELLENGSMSRKDWLKKTLALGQRMYLAGELELRESLSKARLESTLRSLRDHQLLATEDEDTLSMGKEAGGVNGLRTLEQRLAASLP
jgi:glycerol-3-phosphate O-acyltransferase